MYNRFDSHLHSENSPDGLHSITFLCEQAVAAGLSGICITDHCELIPYETEHFDTRIAQSMFDITRCQNIFRGRLSLGAGIELSDTLWDRELTDRIIASHPFDMVMLSHHNLADGADIYYIDFKSWTPREVQDYLDYYFGALCEIAKRDQGDVLAHLTYPLRYVCGAGGHQIDLRRWDDRIEQTLRTVAENGKAIEVNASGLFGPLAETLPPARYIRRYRELGGEYITLGSDAHSAEYVGRGIDEAMQLIGEAGFSHFTFYRQRQPLQLKII